MTRELLEWEPGHRALAWRDTCYPRLARVVEDSGRTFRSRTTHVVPARILPRGPQINGGEWVPHRCIWNGAGCDQVFEGQVYTFYTYEPPSQDWTVMSWWNDGAHITPRDDGPEAAR